MKPLLLFSSLITILCTGSLCFSAIFIAPKVNSWIIEMVPTGTPLRPSFLFASLGQGSWAVPILLVLLTVLGVALFAFFKTLKPKTLAKLATFNCILALASFAGLAGHALCVYISALFGQDSYRLESMVMGAGLEQAALIAGSEGKTDRAFARYKIRNFGSEDLETISEPEKLLATEQWRKISLITGALQQTEEPLAEKRLLATLRQFERNIQKRSSRRKRDETLLQKVNRHSESSFDTLPEALEWISQQTGPEWEPLPLYQFDRRIKS